MKFTTRSRQPIETARSKQSWSRRLIAAAAITTATLALTACSAGDEPKSSGPVALRMTTWSGSEKHKALFDEIANAYIAAHPDKVSSVKFEAIPTDYFPAVTTQLAGGDAPDLIWVAEAYAQEFVSSGVLADLAPAFSSTEGYHVDDLVPAAMSLWKSDKAIYAYPFSTSPFGIYVNLDLLTKAGQPNPRDLIASGDWTWDRLTAIAAAAGASQHVAGLQLSVDKPYDQPNDAIMPIGLDWGARPWSEDGTTCQYNSPESVSFFQWFHQHVYGDKAIPGPGETADFATGKAVFRMGQLSMSAGLSDSFKWDFVPTPSGPKGSIPVIGQGAIGVAAKSKNPSVAADFLAYLTNPTNAAKLAQFFPPPRKSLLNVATLKAAAPALTEQQIQTVVIDQALNGTTKIGHANMSKMADTIRAGLDGLWKPDADVPAVLSDLCSQIAPELKK